MGRSFGRMDLLRSEREDIIHRRESLSSNELRYTFYRYMMNKSTVPGKISRPWIFS